MSKKMWQKIFKSKNKNAKNKNENLKRCSIYEEFQQLNGLHDLNPKLKNCEKSKVSSVKSTTATTKTDETQDEKRSIYDFDLTDHGSSNGINAQKPTQTFSYDEKPLPILSQKSANTESPPQSTFSKVVNTLTLSKRNNHTRKLEIENDQKNVNNSIQPSIASSSTSSSTSTSKSNKKKSATTSITKTKNNFSTNDAKIDSNELTESGAATDLTPCPICSRKFNPVSLSKHIGICEKMATKKRKPFDSSRQRREGTELASYLPKNFGLPANKQTPEHQHLPADDKFVRSTARSSMRKQSNASTASNVSVNTTTSTTSTPTSPKPTALSLARSRHNSTERPKRSKPTPPSSEQCPHCERFFGIKAYDRHVEWCKEKALQAAIKNSSSSEKDKAKERLVARTKYRAPIKTKRSLNREKYAGLPGEEYEGDESPKIISSNTTMTSSVASDSVEEDNVSQCCSKDLEDLERTESHATFVYENTTNMDESFSETEEKVRYNSPCSSFSTPVKDFKNICNTEQFEESANFAEGAGLTFPPSNMAPYELQSTQFAGDMAFYPHMICAPQCPFNLPNFLLSMQQHQQQLQAATYQALFNPIMCNNLYDTPNLCNLEMNTLHLNHQLRKMQRKNQTIAENQTNMPMKAFCLPFESTECLDAMSMPLNLDTSDASEPTDFDLQHSNQGNGDASNSLDDAKQAMQSIDDYLKESLTATLSDMNCHGDEESALINSSYDPFLAAKRQLEELCAPDSPPDNDTRFNTKTISTPTTPSPVMPTTKMTTSLTLGSTSTPTPTISSPLTPNLNVRRSNNIATPAASNFRRTSSLRGPRRSPLLPARPLFAQKRPTIQRGLSDEGPISTNFLKSEEYDEIPVRSVCVNDFAITNSPRVVRRDTSLSNRKNSLKLNLNNSGGTRETSPNSGVGGVSAIGGKALSSDERLTVPNAPKELSKTDSLAVFLKYEKELEKLAIGNGNDAAQFPWDSDSGNKRKTEAEKTLETKLDTAQPRPEALQAKLDAIPSANSLETPTSANSKLAFTKEFKDKSNTLSKQNSAKSLKLDNETIIETNKPTTKETTKLLTEQRTSPPRNNEQSKQQQQQLQHQIRLEPIERSSQIPQPVSNQNTKRPQTSLPPLSQQSIVTPPATQTVNLELIFGNTKPQQQQQQLPQQQIQPATSSSSSTYDKENKTISSSTEYIDPKLINKCDNLPVKLADLKFVDSDSSSEQQHQQQQQRCDRATDPYERYVAPISQLSKLLPLSNKTNPPNPLMRNAQTQSTPKHTKVTATAAAPLNITQQPNSSLQQQVAVVNSNTQRRNSIESATSTNGRNPLKRKMRLGRNQFLYDASPEALDVDSACSADDEANPRSSAEYSPQLHSTFEQMLHQQAPHFPASPPIFDNFDFDEFLSSFENDEEDFQLFRDCREFLKNRNSTTNKQQRAATATTPTANRNTSTPKQIPQTHLNNNSNNFFQFPTLDRNLSRLVTPTSASSTRRSNSKHSIQGLKDMLLNDTSTIPVNSDDFYGERNANTFLQRRSLDMEHNVGVDDDVDNDVIAGNINDNSQKREIFISIETEQSDEFLGRNPISPNSLRNMVGGNPQTLVEVEVDAKENKFSKISDDDDNNNNNNDDDDNAGNAVNNNSAAHLTTRNIRLLPNVQLNNAKNLMQQVSNAERRDEHQNQHTQRSQNSTCAASAGDSDEMSSLDGYPLCSTGSLRRSAGVASKTSADSAYGSLSRQRSNETMVKPAAIRTSSRTRPATAAASMTSGNNVNTATAAAAAAAAAAHMQQKQFLLQQQYQQQQQMLQQQQQQLKYAQAMMKGARSRQLSGSSSSSSDNSLPPILVANPNHFQQQQQQMLMQQQQQQMSQLYQHNKARSRASPTANFATAMDLLNANHAGMMMNSLTTSTGSVAGKPMSRFCHECGSKFMIDQAKFCMDCGVKRLMI